jgi:hypothetical protein
MLETKDMKTRVTQIKTEEPEKVEASRKKTAWDKAKLVGAQGVAAVSVMAAKVGHLASGAGELAKTKIAIHNLQVALDKVYHDIGEKVGQLDKQNKLGAIKPHFSEELKKINDLKEQVKKSQKHIQGISYSS